MMRTSRLLRMPMLAGACLTIVGLAAAADAVVTPTAESIFVYDGTVNTTTYKGNPLAVGDVVDAYDPDGAHCGTFTVSTAGQLGSMPVYKDDGATAGVDEGASSGDLISFTINGDAATVTSCTGTACSGGQVIWTSNGGTADVTLEVPDASLEFSVQPAATAPNGDIISGTVFSTQPVVRAMTDGSLDATFTDSVTLSLATGAGTLSGTLTVKAIAGMAYFTDVAYTASVDGESFSLQADDEASVGIDFGSTNSNALTADVVATKLSYTTQPANSVSATALGTQPVVAGVSAAGLVDAQFTGTVALATFSGGTLSGTQSVAAIAGSATFTDVAYTATSDPQSFTLQASSSGLTSATSNSVSSDVVATSLAFATQPADSYNDAPMRTQPVVIARGPLDVLDVDFIETITLTATPVVGGGTLSGGVSAAAVGGVATFTTAQYDVASDGDTFYLTANDQDGVGSDLATVNSNTIAGSIATMEFSVLPAAAAPNGNVVSGTPFTSQPEVRVLVGGVLDATFSEAITLSLASGSGTLSGTLTVPAVAGVATFTDIQYDATADGEAFALRANDQDGVGGDLSTVDTNPLIADVVATKLAFTTQPAGSVSGAALTTPPVVGAVGANDVPDVDFVGDVALTTLASGALSGTTTQEAVAGVAAFTNVVYTATTDLQAFSLRASSTGLPTATSAAISSDVVATHLAFTTQPGGVFNSVPMLTQPIVTAQGPNNVRDAGFTETVTLTATPVVGGGTLSGTVSVAAVAGVATFGTVQYDVTTAGDSFILTANDEDGTDTDLPVAISDETTGSVYALYFSTQPSATAPDGDIVSGVAYTVQPVVRAVAGGTLDATFNEQVTLSLASGAGALSGDLTVTAVSGEATFTNVVYTAAADGESFTLQADDQDGVGNNFAPGNSSALVADVVATELAFVTEPSGSVSAAILAEQPVVAGVDAAGTTDANFTGTVDLTTAAAGALSGTVSLAAAGGAASFTDVVYTATADGEAFTLTAASTGLTSATSASVSSDVVATHLAFTSQPGNSINGYPLFNQPVVTAVGPGSVTDVDFTETVTLSATATVGGGSLSGGVSVPAVAGVATFVTARYDVDAEDDAFYLTANDEDAVDSDLLLATSDIVVGSETGFIVPLVSGYNLVSLGAPTGNDSITAITSSLTGNLQRVLGFETALNNPNPPVTGAKLYDPSLPAFVNSLKLVDFRLGYWIIMDSEDTLMTGAAGKVVSLPQPSPAGPVKPIQFTEGTLNPVYDFMGIWGELRIDGEPAPAGTVVGVYDGAGNLAGRVEVEEAGYYGFLPIYRDDLLSGVDEGAETGEWLTIAVNGMVTADRVQWTQFGDVQRIDVKAGVSTVLPTAVALDQNYPNPFNPSTTIRYQLPSQQDVVLSVYDVAGQLVRELVSGQQSAGNYTVTWDAHNSKGQPVASGMYIYHLQAGTASQVRKMVLMR